MANQVVNRQVNIYIQSGEAQKALDILIKKENQLKDALQKATNPKDIQRLQTEIDRLQEPLERARKKLSGELSPSFRDVQTAANNLGNRLKRLSKEDADYTEVITQYRQAGRELDEQRGKIGLLQRAMKTFWSEAKTVATGVLIGNTIESMLETVVGYVQGMVTGSAQIADELSDIEKTTGLTGEEVKKVNKELSKIDTRTSSAELRKLASEGGKLGNETVADVVRFVEAADKIKVALGEDLGENALIDIAKTSKIFQTEMLNIASAINEIGAKSEASEAYSVDFLKRMAGTAPTVKLAADEVLGYSAALEIAGQTTEVSSTALNTFFLDFVSNVEEFGKAAGFAKGELTNILNTQGTNEAFLQFLDKLKQANPQADQFINKLSQLGIDGARGSNVMLALSNNIKKIREQQEIANKAIQSNASIMNEFTKKNSNAAAEYDKLKKNFASIFTSSSLQEAGAGVVRLLNSFVNVLKGIPEFVEENRFALLTLAAAIVLLNKQYLLAALASGRSTIATAIDTVAKKASMIITALSVAGQLAYATILDLVAKRITLATAAQRLWNIAMSIGAGPLGIILATAAALTIGISALFNRTRQLTAEQKLQADIAKRVSDATTETITKVDLLTKAAGDNTRSLDERKKALESLIAINPQYLQGLTLENIATAEGAKIINGYVEGLKKKAEAEAKYALLVDKQKEKQDLLNKVRTELPKLANLSDSELEKQLEAYRKSFRSTGALGKTIASAMFEDYDAVNSSIEFLNKGLGQLSTDTITGVVNANTNLVSSVKSAGVSIDSLNEKLKALRERRDASTDDNERKGLNSQISETEKQLARLEGRTVSVSKAEKKLAKDTADLQKELREIAFDLGLNNLGDFEKEMAQLNRKYDALREKAHGNNKLLLQIDSLFYQEREQLVSKSFAKDLEKVKQFDEKKAQLDRERLTTNLQRLATVTIPERVLQIIDRENRERFASAELSLMQSHGKDKLSAELRLLDLQRQQELQAKEHTETEKLLIEEKFRQKRHEAEINHWAAQINQMLDWAGQMVNVFGLIGDARTNQENAELERDRRINDKRKRNLESTLNAGLVTQVEYDRKLQEMEKAQENREKIIRMKQFRRDQRMQVTQALMNGAQAVVSTLAARPGSLDIVSLGAFRVINIALAVATTAAQVAAIASRKPPEFGRGGFLQGPSHSDRSKGMPVVHPYTGQVQAFLEGGEGIGSKRTMNDRKRYHVEGTPSQIFSLLNAKNGGVHWESGAVLRPGWHTQRPQPMNVSAINSSINAVRQFYALGGKFQEGGDPAPAPDQPNSSEAMLQLIMSLISTNTNLNQTLSELMLNGVNATVSLSELKSQEKRLELIQEDATWRG